MYEAKVRGAYMKEETIENIRRSWKVQTFQYDYISHIKGKFVFIHLLVFVSSWILIATIHHHFGLLLVPCMVSWDYFVFFDKSRMAYKDSYMPVRYELIGTLFTTILFCLFFVFSFVSNYLHW